MRPVSWVSDTMQVSVRNGHSAADPALHSGDGLPNPLQWIEMNIMVDVSIFPISLPLGLSKTCLCQMLLEALNLLRNMCSPDSQLPPPSIAPVHLNLKMVIQKQPKAVLPCATISKRRLG